MPVTEFRRVLFRSDGSLERYEIAPYGYLIGHYSKYIVPGSVRLKIESNDPRVRVAAFKRPDGSLVIIGLNNNLVAVRARITLTGLATIPTGMMTVLTSREGALWQNGGDTAVQNSEISVNLAPLSITTLSSR